MSKVLRLHNIGVDTLEDWQDSSKYGSAVIKQIQDPSGATTKHEITSIPSPFARIDLVKSAFRYVFESKNLDGDTIFHKMVSDTLDVAEIFFKSNVYSDRVKIVFWDRNEHLEELRSGNASNKILASTLSMYLEQDKSAYNFDKMRRIYILLYVGDKRKKEYDVLGATSPATLFFSIANDLSYVSHDIPFNTDFPFDTDYNPLYKRDSEFIKYLFAIKKSYRNFADYFPEVNNYLDLTYENLSPDIKNEISKLDKTSIETYEPLMTSDGNNDVEIIEGLKYHTRPQNTEVVDSDFIINSTLKKERILVLPVEKGSKYNGLTLTQGKWDGKNPAPYKNDTEIQKRRLPQTNEVFPYLTISDFLEDTIIRMPYQLNSEAFYDANTEKQNVSYFLPLKDTFFKYFSADDVINEKMIEFQKNSGGVKVLLHIPIQKGKTIDYERIYFADSEPNLDKNEGALVSKNDYFGFALMPNIRFEKKEQANYRFALLSQDDKAKYSVDFFNTESERISSVMMAQRNTGDKKYPTNLVYSVEKDNIDVIRVSDSQNSGVLLPILNQQQSNSNFTFAIDFGTSNTHIVCKSDNLQTHSFDITKSDRQIQLNSDHLSENIEETIYQELCPDYIGDGQVTKFPMRSALLVSKNLNWSKPHFALGEANFASLYEKKARYDYNKVETNLKWSNSSDNEQIIKCYIESLFFYMRNKVIMNNGRLESAKVLWTYPLSMTLARKNTFKRVWEEAYKKFFSDDTTNLFDLNESVAPYYYFKTKNASVNNIVTVDIGGGTTDIVIANHNDINCISSFRFAANSIFGDMNEHNEGQLNGIVRQFKDKMEHLLDSNNLINIRKILNNLYNENNSANISSLFFSLKSNKDLADKKIDIDFFRELQLDNTQKITFLIFYCAIIYHLAMMMKAKKFDMPRHIGFSGNGSKIINILTTDRKLLETLTKTIFEKIYGTKYTQDDLTIVMIDNPKEATSMGAILNNKNDDFQTINSKKQILLGIDSDTFATSDMSYNTINSDIKYYIDKVKGETEKFIDFVFSLNKGDISFRDSFGIEQSSIDTAKQVCKKDIKTYCETKLYQKLDEVVKEDSIEETMFFYPLTGILNSLSTEICDNSLNNPAK